MKLDNFIDRYEYLRLYGIVGSETFGFDRWLNQKFYRSKEWRNIRDFVIARDNGCDLGCLDRPIGGRIYIHHMNPIGPEDIVEANGILLDPEFLICASKETHDAIHYGSFDATIQDPITRYSNDTCPWKK